MSHNVRFQIISGVIISTFLILSGCQTPGENLQANVYKENQVNSAQKAKVVKILAVMPAKIEVDNSQNQKTATTVGALLGAVGGGVLGNEISAQKGTGTVVGAVAGGAGGGAVGSLVPGKVLVAGVSITYVYNGKTLNSAQVGRLCEYTPGKAVVISTSPTETRIQPNATCPIKHHD
jgi:outer membrane lipoprotein SlyB